MAKKMKVPKHRRPSASVSLSMTRQLKTVVGKKKRLAWYTDASLLEVETRKSEKKMGDWAMRLAFVLNECGSKSERDTAIRKAKVILDTLSGGKSKGVRNG